MIEKKWYKITAKFKKNAKSGSRYGGKEWKKNKTYDIRRKISDSDLKYIKTHMRNDSYDILRIEKLK